MAHYPCSSWVQVIESFIVSNAFRETMVLFQSAGDKGILYSSGWFQLYFSL